MEKINKTLIDEIALKADEKHVNTNLDDIRDKLKLFAYVEDLQILHTKVVPPLGQF